MTWSRSHIIALVIGGLLIPVLLIVHLIIGDLDVSLNDIFGSLNNSESTSYQIIWEFRFPRVVMAAIAGACLSIAGLLMQTLFNNPLAGPYVLGINSGSSLLVALTTMTGFTFFQSDVANIFSALVGAFLFGLVILAFARWIKSTISLLLVGLMLGSFTSAFIALMQSKADLQSLKSFTMWSLGSLQNVALDQLPTILLTFIIGLIIAALIVKPLNNLVLGESHTKLVGYNVKQLRIVIIAITAVFTGLVTAFCGPISFVGLAVPNILRIALKTQNHAVLLIGTVVFGASFVMICDLIIRISSDFIHIPINVLTALIGAPVVVVILIKKLA
ncbi:MAG: FecCD family ABC transporter permease [Crocinitomicaceae bacterium]